MKSSHSGLEIIAEVGQAHDGSVGIAHSYIDALKGTGVTAVKFQTHVAEAESSIFEEFRVPFSYEDATRYDYWKRMEFSEEEWIGLKNHCEEVGLEFLSSPFSNKAVDLLESIGVKRYKIGSGEVSNYLMLAKIASTRKDIILSSGLSTLSDLDATVSFLRKFDLNPSILQCTSEYPAMPENWGLFEIPRLKKRFNCTVGFSDHSGDLFASAAAVAFGAEIIEFHVVFDKKCFGPDSKASIEVRDINHLVTGLRNIYFSMHSVYSKSGDSINPGSKIIFGKSLCVNRSVQKGEIVCFEILDSKKPAKKGITPSDYEKVIGKRFLRSKNKWDFVNWEDLI